MRDVLKPSVALLSKLGSIAVHVEEAMTNPYKPTDADVELAAIVAERIIPDNPDAASEIARAILAAHHAERARQGWQLVRIVKKPRSPFAFDNDGAPEPGKEYAVGIDGLPLPISTTEPPR